jgi:serine beta-lactamase-like protein LACTB, mitochondrial
VPVKQQRHAPPAHRVIVATLPHALCRLAMLALLAPPLGPLHAQEPPASSAGRRAHIEDTVAKFMASRHVPGLAVAVVEGGEYRWGSGFGFADLEGNVPASEHSLFRLASISKTLTAVGAMQLWERGRLDLDAAVQKYCPAFPSKPWPVTTRQVLGHLAGIRHYRTESEEDAEYGNTRHFDNPIAAGLDFFKDDPLLTPPGVHYHYSTQGYTLVGCVMEGAAGTPYADYMRRNVFIPAGMEQTRADDRFAIIPYRSRFYRQSTAGAIENADFLDSSYKLPGGGWLSSAQDMARFEVAILQDKLLRQPTLEVMWTQLNPADGAKPEDIYGLGWELHTVHGIPAVGHTGSQQGTSTAFLIAPAQRAGVVVLSNLEDAKTKDLATQILEIVLDTH